MNLLATVEAQKPASTQVARAPTAPSTGEYRGRQVSKKPDSKTVSKTQSVANGILTKLGKIFSSIKNALCSPFSKLYTRFEDHGKETQAKAQFKSKYKSIMENFLLSDTKKYPTDQLKLCFILIERYSQNPDLHADSMVELKQSIASAETAAKNLSSTDKVKYKSYIAQVANAKSALEAFNANIGIISSLKDFTKTFAARARTRDSHLSLQKFATSIREDVLANRYFPRNPLRMLDSSQIIDLLNATICKDYLNPVDIKDITNGSLTGEITLLKQMIKEGLKAPKTKEKLGSFLTGAAIIFTAERIKMRDDLQASGGTYSGSASAQVYDPLGNSYAGDYKTR